METVKWVELSQRNGAICHQANDFMKSCGNRFENSQLTGMPLHVFMCFRQGGGLLGFSAIVSLILDLNRGRLFLSKITQIPLNGNHGYG